MILQVRSLLSLYIFVSSSVAPELLFAVVTSCALYRDAFVEVKLDVFGLDLVLWSRLETEIPLFRRRS
jgi:hypothetical protein